MLKRASKITMYVSLGIISLIVGVGAFSQTGAFRATLRSTLYELLKSEINANVYMGEISGNLFTGFSVDTLFLYVDNAPFVEAGRVKVQYDPLKLFNKNVSVTTLEIDNPSVHLFRYTDGSWNTSHLITSADSTVDSVPSAWKVNVKNLQLRNATVMIIDSTGNAAARIFDENGNPSVNYSNIELRRVDLELGGSYAADAQSVSIRRLAFDMPQQRFRLNELRAELEHDTNAVRVRQLLVRTPDSYIDLSADMHDIELLSVRELEDLRNVPLSLTLRPSVVHSRDLQVFLPELYFMKGPVAVSSIMKGVFGEINVNTLKAQFGTSSIDLSGRVSNLHTPRALYLDITSNKSNINPMEVPQMLPFFHIPEYPDIGRMVVDFHYVGEPLNFKVTGSAGTDAGAFAYDVALDIRDTILAYTARAEGRGVQLHKIFSDSTLNSDINAVATIEGKGVSVDELDAFATVRIDSSRFRQMEIRESFTTFHGNNRTIFTRGAVVLDQGRFNFRSTFDYRRQFRPLYTIAARCDGIDLSPIIEDPLAQSQLSFDLQWEGSSLNVLEGESELGLQFRKSFYNGVAFDSVNASVGYKNNENGEKEISIKSPIADFVMHGQFEAKHVINNLQTQIRNVRQFYVSQRRITDSLYVFDEHSVDAPADTQQRNITGEYSLTLKNLRPIATFFHLPELDAKGQITGHFIERHDEISFVAKADIANAYYADTLFPIGIINTNVSLQFANNPLQPSSFAGLHSLVTVEGNKVILGRTTLTMPNVTVDIAEQRGTFALYSDLDTTMSFGMEGTVVIDTEKDSLTIHQGVFRYQGFDLTVDDPFSIVVGRTGVSVDSMVLHHREEQFVIRGSYQFDDQLKLHGAVSQFDLADIYFFMRSIEAKETALALGGIFSASFEVTGTSHAPVIFTTVEGTGFSHKGVVVGDVYGSLQYANRNVVTNARIKNTGETKFNEVMLQGNIPIDLSFTQIEERTNIPGLNVFVTTENLQIDIFDPFIPELTNMTGNVNAQILCSGSLEAPVFKGEAVLQTGQFLLETTGITYTASGTMSLEQDRITFPDFSVSNIVTDYSVGTVAIGGYILLNGFLPQEYHLNAKGELLVLNETSRLQGGGIFGTLIAATDANGLSFEGSFEQSRIRGAILINQANLTFPPTQTASTFSFAKFSSVTYYDDTSQIVIDTTVQLPIITSIQKTIEKKESKKERTFLDGFGYDLTIETKGNVRVNMIFNANAGAYEELYAELNGKLSLTQDEKGTRLLGTINVGNESNYTFYKKFNASGSLTFVGPVDNPQLNILAKYEGTHCKEYQLGDCTADEQAVVTLNISGTRTTPNLKIGLFLVDQEGKEIPRTGDIDNDAISFLLTSAPGTPGKFREELTSQDRNRITEQITQSIGGTYLNSMLSGYVMDFIQKNNIPFVKKFEVRQVVGADPDVRIGAELLEAYVNIGGRVFTDINNANISVQIPLGDTRRRNFMLEVEKKTENLDYTIQARTTLGARIFYRFTF